MAAKYIASVIVHVCVCLGIWYVGDAANPGAADVCESEHCVVMLTVCVCICVWVRELEPADATV